MDSEQILKGINDDDVIHITGVTKKRTFCISEFRTIIKTAAIAMKNAYASSLRNQRYLLHTSEIDESDYRTHLGSYSESESRFIISLTKQRFIFVVAFPNILS
jgi:hypothetical protein